MTPFAIGQYTVYLRKKPGPGCALYAVFLGAVKIGQCVSLPGVSDCEWLERVQRQQSFYAFSSAPLPMLTTERYGNNQYGRGKNYVARKRR